MKLNNRELATVLAALRTFQNLTCKYTFKGLPLFYDIEPLTNDEIDNLCEQFNCGDGENEIITK